MVALVYSPGYNITAFGLERLHPFDSVKYGRIQRWLVAEGHRAATDFVAPATLSREQLLSVHSEAYLESLRQRRVLFDILEVAAVRFLPAWVTEVRVLRAMRLATAGTLTACRLALQTGIGLNLGGGYHHAFPERGSGFCVYADIPLALCLLHQQGLLRTALVIDIDAHQGDGVAAALRPYPWAHLLDFFEEALFPWPKQAEEMPVPLRSGLRWPEYRDILAAHIPAALDRLQPDLVVCNAGSDVLLSDPLTTFQLSVEEMVQRDLYVVEEVRRRNIPFALTLSGGYGPDSWRGHAASMASIIKRCGASP
jgi:histone deacetylase 11